MKTKNEETSKTNSEKKTRQTRATKNGRRKEFLAAGKSLNKPSNDKPKEIGK